MSIPKDQVVVRFPEEGKSRSTDREQGSVYECLDLQILLESPTDPVKVNMNFWLTPRWLMVHVKYKLDMLITVENFLVCLYESFP